MKVKRIVVFIDDLDRCDRRKVIDTFETIKLFLDIPECTFVIGADAEKIEAAIGDVYDVTGRDRARFSRDYLEKIVQVPFRIPEQQLGDIACYMGMLVLQAQLNEEGWAQLLADRDEFMTGDQGIFAAFNEWVLKYVALFRSKTTDEALKELKAVQPYAHIVAHGLEGNPRRIKRFLNILNLRQRLADKNKLEVKPELLIKFTVLEYAWGEFFERCVETFDPDSGVSQLAMEVTKLGEAEKKDADSEWVTEAQQAPGLVDFLVADAALDKSVKWGPYLYLAQTALDRRGPAQLASFDDTAKSFASRIASGDRVRSNAAARQAARTEASVVVAVVRSLIPQAITAEDDRVLTHILTGLDTICQRTPALYRDVLSGLEQVRMSEKGAAGFAAATLLQNAARRDIEIPEDLRKRVAGGSKTAEALLATTDKKKGK